jgi:hypothetical protein
VLDTLRDWRFRESAIVTNLGARFYAGVPLFCSDLTGLGKPGEVFPIGTLVGSISVDSFLRDLDHRV